MKKHKLLYSTTVFILLVSGNGVQANTPELSFAGGFNYAYSDVTSIGFLTITGNLNGFQDLSIAPALANSQFTLTSIFQSAVYGVNKTEGIFGTSVTQLNPWDFTITGGDNTNLLQGSVNSLAMSGINGFSFGLLSADLDIVKGALANDFNIGSSSLLGLTFNMSTPLASNIFQTSFSGDVNGLLTAKAVNVPEISSIFLMLAGFLGLIGSQFNFLTKKN